VVRAADGRELPAQGGKGLIAERIYMHILVVEDEQRLAQNLAKALSRNAGFVVDVALDGNDGLHLAKSGVFDAIILDLMLPGMSGNELLSALRATGSKTPVLVLTAREDKSSIIGLLDGGADDYLAKPFDLGELMARVKALVRRSNGQASSSLVLGDLVVNINTRSAARADKYVELTPMEYRTLEYLMMRQGSVVSKEELLEHLYDYNWEKFSNVIEVYISTLRRKIDAVASERLIHTLRGHGYMLRRRGVE
jgi:DNA-binding response OmpR family regulator